MQTRITTSIKLGAEHQRWVVEQGRGFNFSEWVRLKIDEEIMKKSPKVEA